MNVNINKEFPGGNIEVIRVEGDSIYLKNEIRDTKEDWFYWAFCVEGAAGKKIKFVFDNEWRVGYYGAAVSHDLKTWHWSNTRIDGATFEYEFGKDEDKVYFAHNMLYLPSTLYDFAKEHDIEMKVLADSKKGRKIPYIKFGTGKNHLVLTARHHACEATGSYVLEGVLEELNNESIEDMTVFCIPMMDFDGVCDGDQGKERRPHDHNRDYVRTEKPIYETVSVVRKYIDDIKDEQIGYCFDFHSPWHLSGVNDKVFIVHKSVEYDEKINRLGVLLQENITEDSLKYNPKDDFPANTLWNKDGVPDFVRYCLDNKNINIACSLETCYFGDEDNIFTQSKARELGRSFGKTIRMYIDEQSNIDRENSEID